MLWGIHVRFHDDEKRGHMRSIPRSQVGSRTAPTILECLSRLEKHGVEIERNVLRETRPRSGITPHAPLEEGR